jgi:hypothetical protein
MAARDELVGRARQYCERRQLLLGERLGYGVHGIVFAAESHTGAAASALKVHERVPDYRRERDVYLRLRQHGVQYVRDCAVPVLIGYDDELLAIEMTVVSPPFALDFAGAYLDQPPAFPDDVLADWHAEKLDQFGPRWPEVQAILRELESHGMFLIDVSPNNIALG